MPYTVLFPDVEELKDAGYESVAHIPFVIRKDAFYPAEAKLCGLPLGIIQMQDPFGATALWTVRQADAVIWITKNVGDPALPNDEFVQVIRTFDGRITLKLSS